MGSWFYRQINKVICESDSLVMCFVRYDNPECVSETQCGLSCAQTHRPYNTLLVVYHEPTP